MAEKELDKRVERSRRLLIDALLTLMKDCPYSKISVAHIAEQSGVARPTFYLHFHSKDDLLIAYIDEMFEKFYAEIDGYITKSKDADPVIASIIAICTISSVRPKPVVSVSNTTKRKSA